VGVVTDLLLHEVNQLDDAPLDLLQKLSLVLHQQFSPQDEMELISNIILSAVDLQLASLLLR
jgi:hypothetical protein